MNKLFVVIVDQSDPPGSLNAVQAFGPYSLATADAVMGDINSEAMEGELTLNTIVVAPINEGNYNINSITSLLKQRADGE